ncbi:MAG: radical SAM protein [bacterium]
MRSGHRFPVAPAERLAGARATPGFEVRRRHFPPVMEFYAPGLKRWETSEWKPTHPRRFLPVSVTGRSCALQCDHCKAKVLDGMLALPPSQSLFELARRLRAEGTEGLLVSGGSTRTGGVPLLPHLPDVQRIRLELGMRVVVHSGFVSPEVAAALARAGVDGVMLDVIGADETIREVYHLDRTVSDVERSLALLADQGLRIIPHIVLGLHYGRFLGEYRALDLVARYPVSTLVLVVLVPLSGTPMAALQPPPPQQVTEFFGDARRALPRTKINLGCARPMAAAKAVLDRAAVDHGLNGIAYPAEGIVEYARSRGLEPRFYEFCCSLTWTAGQGVEVTATP